MNTHELVTSRFSDRKQGSELIGCHLSEEMRTKGLDRGEDWELRSVHVLAYRTLVWSRLKLAQKLLWARWIGLKHEGMPQLLDSILA